MSDGSAEERFFARCDRLRGRLSSLVVAVALSLVLVGVTVGIGYATATGLFFKELPTVQHAGTSHVVRSHGWGGYYLGMAVGGMAGRRSHFGGGGRIH